MSTYMASKKTLEVNPAHPIIKELKAKIDADKSDKTIKDVVWLLLDAGLLASGFSLEAPAAFSARIYRMLSLGLGLAGGDSSSGSTPDDLPPLEDAKASSSAMEALD